MLSNGDDSVANGGNDNSIVLGDGACVVALGAGTGHLVHGGNGSGQVSGGGRVA